MRAIVLGTQSFVDGGTKVGSQHVAQALAAAGWLVDYVPTLSSPMDVMGRKRHARLARAWGHSLRERSVEVSPGVTEWSLQSAYPAHRLFLRWRWQLEAYGQFIAPSLRNTRFDACIADVAPNMLLLHQISARAKVCRLNDWPGGFAHDLHPVLVREMETMVGSPLFDEVWAVSQPLVDYARAMRLDATVAHLPNGVDVGMLAPDAQEHHARTREARSAVYVGGQTAWLDIDLLYAVARLLPDWTFDVRAPGEPPPQMRPANLHWGGSVGRAELPTVLHGKEVGLIPFRNADDRMRYVERPLKFYEYLAAGLGVASTDLGALKSGMGDWACYGNGAEAFAAAVVSAREQAVTRPPGFVQGFVHANSWDARAQTLLSRLDGLLA